MSSAWLTWHPPATRRNAKGRPGGRPLAVRAILPDQASILANCVPPLPSFFFDQSRLTPSFSRMAEAT